ncbi:MAG: 2-dehydropantoate 2-reductase [Chloroflexi bacterium]|nr:2-dehydropantoate 2-reductase [Chloroflexota bacterium]
MRILVIGAGAIGCLLGGRLANSGHDVTLVGRPWLVEAVKAYGLDIAQEPGEHIHIRDIQVTENIAGAFALQPEYDLALLTTKAHDVLPPIINLSEETDTLPLVVTFQNGVGTEETIAEIIGENRMIAGIISVPVSMTGPAVIETVQRGGIGIAPVTNQVVATPIVEALRGAGFEVAVYDDFRAMKWSKLLLNIIGNATSAILGWPPERVYANQSLFDMERATFLEALQVMAAMNLHPVALPGYPLPTLVPWIRRVPSFILRPIVRRAVRTGRGGKMPSMYVDLVAGKKQLEVGVLNGAVAKQGEQLEIPVPINKKLTDILQQIAGGKIPREKYCDHPQVLLDAVL